MSLTYGFYNSLNGDRPYNATDMSNLFDGIINDGVFMSVGTAFVVNAYSGMTVHVGIGRAWFKHTWTYNDAILPLTLDLSEVVLNRIDTVVLEVDSTDAVRANSIKIIKGTPATNPVNPTLTKTAQVNQYPLAHIRINKGVTEITQANITNKVGTSDTPFVTGILATMNIDALIAQWGTEWTEWNNEKRTAFLDWISTQELDFTTWSDAQKAEFIQWSTDNRALFDAWFALARDTLGEDSAGNLLNLINTNTASINELFTSVSNSKEMLAAAVTDKRQPTSSSDTFAKISENISNINMSRYELKKLSTYELMTLYGFDPVRALQLTK